jgi:hypothetical protein
MSRWQFSAPADTGGFVIIQGGQVGVFTADVGNAFDRGNFEGNQLTRKQAVIGPLT